MASFTAAGTAYANYGVPMIPFFIYYSMFGFQRVGDLIWAFADSRGKGFLWAAPPAAPRSPAKACSTRTGTASCSSSTVPTCATYDPAFAYEIAVIIQDGIRRMYEEREDRFYYITLYNENYRAAADAGEAAARAFSKASTSSRRPKREGRQVQLFGSGPILNEALRAQEILRDKYRLRRTCGASPATTNCAATRWLSSAGTACIPTEPEKTSVHRASRWTGTTGRSSPPPTT